ncbi:MAG: hypothetical protein ACLR0U_14180 [Enterocloster clostridioformis]
MTVPTRPLSTRESLADDGIAAGKDDHRGERRQDHRSGLFRAGGDEGKSAGVYDQIREAVGDELVDSLLNAIDAAK